MNTYYLFDVTSNSWSRKHVPLRTILTIPGITDNHLLADARTGQTLTVGEARANCNKVRLVSPEKSLLKWALVGHKSAKPTACSPSGPSAPAAGKPAITSGTMMSRVEYKVLDANDPKLSGRVNAESLSYVLNAYAREGWKVSVGSQLKPDSEFLIVLEREYKRVNGR